jgi:hypothetical protein
MLYKIYRVNLASGLFVLDVSDGLLKQSSDCLCIILIALVELVTEVSHRSPEGSSHVNLRNGELSLSQNSGNRGLLFNYIRLSSLDVAGTPGNFLSALDLSFFVGEEVSQ